ncbi:MAG: hypothetical protein AB7U20_18410 [Planctomycetaceae bacterium]
MSSLSHSLWNRYSVRIAAAVFCVGMASVTPAPAAENVPALVDEAISQILADETTDRMAKFLESYQIGGLESLSAAGSFRNLSSETLKQQLTKSLGRHGIVIDGSTRMRLQSTLAVTETKEAVIVVMKCSLSEGGSNELCTVQVRKVLPAGSGI